MLQIKDYTIKAVTNKKKSIEAITPIPPECQGAICKYGDASQTDKLVKLLMKLGILKKNWKTFGIHLLNSNLVESYYKSMSENQYLINNRVQYDINNIIAPLVNPISQIPTDNTTLSKVCDLCYKTYKAYEDTATKYPIKEFYLLKLGDILNLYQKKKNLFGYEKPILRPLKEIKKLAFQSSENFVRKNMYSVQMMNILKHELPPIDSSKIRNEGNEASFYVSALPMQTIYSSYKCKPMKAYIKLLQSKITHK